MRIRSFDAVMEPTGNSGFSALLFEHIPLPASALPSQIHCFPYFFSAEKQRKTGPHQRISPHASAKETEKAAIFFKNPARFSARFLYPQRPHTIVRFHFLHRSAPYRRLFFPSPPLSGHFPASCIPIPGKSPCQPKPRFSDKKKAGRQKQKIPSSKKDEGTFI